MAWRRLDAIPSETILGHPPTAAEIRLEEDLLMAATASSSTTTTEHAQRVPEAPQSR